MEAIEGFPLLEELELSNCCGLQLKHREVLEVAAKECLRLKCLRYRRLASYYAWNRKDDGEAMAIAKMHELRSLHLAHNGLTNQGLEAILNKCVHLESLDIHNCPNIRMNPKMRARIDTKKLLLTNFTDEKREVSNPDSPISECPTCLDYFGRDKYSYYWKCFNDIEESYPKHYVNDMEAMVISTVYELRSLQLYRNDLTTKGLAAILDKCPHLDSLDVWNCLNIVRDNALQAKDGWIKTKKLTTRLLTDYSDHRIFNPEGVDLHNCYNIILNKCRNIFVNGTLGDKYKRIILRKKARKYHRNNKKMLTEIEEYIKAKLHKDIGNIDFMEFDGAKFTSRFVKKKFTSKYYRLDGENIERCYGYKYRRDFGEKFEPGGECSTCLMFGYFAERWGVLDLDDYADYYDPSYGLDGHDETDFAVHDRMIGKRLRRYLKME